jgi:Phage tail tube protein
MTTQWDAQLGFKKESTWGTVVTPDVFPEITSEDLAWQPTFAQGAGMRVGRRVDYSSRRVLVKEEVGGSFTVEAVTKGLGKLFEAAMGNTGTSTLISGSAYQQLFTPTTTDPVNSYTIQVAIPPIGGGTTLAQTFAGMVCTGFDFTVGNAAIPEVTFNWMGKAVDTSTGLATASYATSVAQFSFIHAAITIGGAVTVPSTTALATGGTATANISDFSLSYDNGFDTSGFNFGSAGKRSRKQAVGTRAITGSITAEWDAATLRDAYLAQTDLALVFTLQTGATTGGTVISGAIYPALQFTIPIVRLEGEIPKSNGGEPVTLSIDFTGLDGGVAAHPLYVAIVTAETAI